MNNVFATVAQMYFACAIFGVSCMICMVPALPIMAWYERDKKLANGNMPFKTEITWSIALCILSMAAFAAAVALAIRIGQLESVQNIMQATMEWINTVF